MRNAPHEGSVVVRLELFEFLKKKVVDHTHEFLLLRRQPRLAHRFNYLI
jgi:hypothetical protein